MMPSYFGTRAINKYSFQNTFRVAGFEFLLLGVAVGGGSDDDSSAA